MRTQRDNSGAFAVLGQGVIPFDWRAKGVLIVSLALGVAATAVVSRANLLLGYFDAEAHLKIARRVAEAPDSILTELGTVWLPLPHLLLLPFVGLDWMWRTGLAGSVVGALSLAASSFAIFALARWLSGSALAGAVAWLLFVLNPGVLYLQSMAMTEIPFLAMATGATYFLAVWQSNGRPGALWMASCCSAAAVLTRYEGWPFALALALAATTLGGRRDLLRSAFPPLAAAAAWFCMNWAVFGDPMAFQRGEYSSEAQMRAAFGGQLPCKGNWAAALVTYGHAMLSNYTGWTLAAAGAGLLLALCGRGFRRKGLALLPLLAAGPFHALSLYLGQIVIQTPDLTPHIYNNLRYALLLIPGVAIAAGLSMEAPRRTAGLPLAALGAAALIVSGVCYWVRDLPASAPVVMESVYTQAGRRDQVRAARFLRESYRHGIILADDVANEVVTGSGVPWKFWVTPSRKAWREALPAPVRSVDWIVLDRRGTNDKVARGLKAPPSQLGFDLVFSDRGREIYLERRQARELLAARVPRPAAGRGIGGVLADLRESQWRGADLRGARFPGADLERSDAEGADLRAARLQFANLSRANLRAADLRGAQLGGASLTETNLTNAHLERTDLRRADLENADLRGAALAGSDLRGARLQGALLDREQLRDANYTRADLTGARFVEARRP